MAEPRLKVLYVAGNGRSGSTLLDVILGQVPGLTPVGEVRDVWDYGLVENRPCGCGEPLRQCEVWREILAEAYGDDLPDPSQVAGWREHFARTKRLLPILAKGDAYARGAEIERYLGVLERLYHGVARATDARVVVDSSKWPTYAFLLSRIASIDLHVLHLVRDPRACAFSWSRVKQAEPGRFLDQQGPAYTTSFWVVWNPAIRTLFGDRADRYRMLRYEDFAARPRESIGEVLRFVGDRDAPSPFVSEDEVCVETTHTVEGNAARFQRGRVAIRTDDEWQRGMPRRSRAVVTAMTWPLLRRYGYPVAGVSARSRDARPPGSPGPRPGSGGGAR